LKPPTRRSTRRSLPDEKPEAGALRLSEAKARAVVSLHPDALIIGSDQVACLDGQVFGKPGTHENAVRQLQTMRGRRVNFFTGLCLLDAASSGGHIGAAYRRWSPSAT
jgi:septum formation protein